MIRDLPIDPEFECFTPDGLITDVFIIDEQGRAIAYLSPEERAVMNADNAAIGLPPVADVQPEKINPPDKSLSSP